MKCPEKQMIENSKGKRKTKKKQANKPTTCGSTHREVKRERERAQRVVEKTSALGNLYDSAMITSNWKFYCTKKFSKNFKHATCDKKTQTKHKNKANCNGNAKHKHIHRQKLWKQSVYKSLCKCSNM